MAKKLAPIDMYNSSAAYDLYQYDNFESTAAPEIQHQGLPEENYVPQRQRRVKAKAVIAPFAVIGLAVAACMMVLVVFGYVQLYEATERVTKLQNELTDLQEEKAVLESIYEASIDLEEVETRAAELGLSTPNREQTVYLNLSGSDRAEILKTEEINFFQRVIRAIKSSAGGLVEYMS